LPSLARFCLEGEVAAERRQPAVDGIAGHGLRQEQTSDGVRQLDESAARVETILRSGKVAFAN
jgi:hypothetical protein